MRVAKTKYYNLSNEELLNEADRMGLNLSEVGRELMYRLEAEHAKDPKLCEDCAEALDLRKARG